jgi:hypothetical protein
MTPRVNQDMKTCGCGRSATGFCTGLHSLTTEEWDKMLMDDTDLVFQEIEDDDEAGA